MNKLQWVISIVLLTCSACISTQNVDKPLELTEHVDKPSELTACYKAILEDKTYIIGLYDDSTFVFGRDVAEIISLGTYNRTKKELVLSSYIQSFDKVPFLVKESYKKDQEGTILKLSIVVRPYLFSYWFRRMITKVDLDGLNCPDTLPTVSTDFDSIYTVECTQEVKEKISFFSRYFDGLEYKLKDSKSNYFECFYLGPNIIRFCFLNAVKGTFNKNQIQLPAYLLDKEIEDKSLLLTFEEVKEVIERIGTSGMNPTPEGAMLEAHYYLTKAGRMALIKNDSLGR